MIQNCCKIIFKTSLYGIFELWVKFLAFKIMSTEAVQNDEMAI